MIAPAARPRRSALYMPASNARALEKAATLDADVLIFDLEDAVAPDAKDRARAQALAALASGRYRAHEVLVRINARDTPWHAADLAALTASTTARPDGILLPKIDRPDDVAAVRGLLGDHVLPLWAMIETPRAVLNAPAIARAAHVVGLIAGVNDLAKELGADDLPDRAPLLTSLSLILLAARAEGIAALDGVHNDLQDLEGFVAACRQGKALGFDGKTLIHPDQIDPCNAVFAPTPAAVADARALIAAYEKAEAEGKGVALFRGRMIESLHVEGARRILDLAQAVSRRAKGRG